MAPPLPSTRPIYMGTTTRRILRAWNQIMFLWRRRRPHVEIVSAVWALYEARLGRNLTGPEASTIRRAWAGGSARYPRADMSPEESMRRMAGLGLCPRWHSLRGGRRREEQVWSGREVDGAGFG